MPTSSASKRPSIPSLAAVEHRRTECLKKREQLLKIPGLPGTPLLAERRVSILARAKAEPTFFIRKPEYEPNPRRERMRRALEAANYPSNLLNVLSKGFRVRPSDGRATVLRDGYLYAEDPELAFALVTFIGLEQLFDADKVWIQRGERTLYAKRSRHGTYTYANGPAKGKRARLILFDRVGTGKPGPPLHRDFRSLRYRLHFDHADVEHITEDRIAATLHYGGYHIPSILKANGARLELECEAVPPEAAVNLALHRERGERKLRVTQRLREVMLAQIDERLPFDEPHTEFGQQDGKLRLKWISTYSRGLHKFDFNGDDYWIFDNQGRPRVPQVCVDFLTDTFERAAGTWWAKMGEKPAHITGNLDFKTTENQDLRRVPGFVEFAGKKPEWFTVYTTPPTELIPFWRKQEFYGHLTKNALRYQPGDIIVIRGYTNFERKWERKIMHYHSFFVFETDPISGIPISIVGNAGFPELRVWETEARRTPKRSIWHRIRPQLYWLESVVPKEYELSRVPAPLAFAAD